MVQWRQSLEQPLLQLQNSIVCPAMTSALGVSIVCSHLFRLMLTNPNFTQKLTRVLYIFYQIDPFQWRANLAMFKSKSSPTFKSKSTPLKNLESNPNPKIGS